MFSFLKFFNSKSDVDKNKAPNNLSGKTLNLNSPEARALNIFNTKSPIARKPNGNNTPFRSNCNDTVTSPGFSFRVAQRAREMKLTTPNTDVSNLSASYILENSLNCSNTMNGVNTSKDVYDKKRKLMETLDNFGVRKRTRQESGVEAFVNRRRKTISESNAPDRVNIANGYTNRLTQPISTIMSTTSINIENKKTKRHGDFELNLCHLQKKPKTRNNEILSSYSSSKFLLTPGQKRPYSADHEDKSPDRKHCKSCTCCGSTMLIVENQNNLNKSDKTTETDLSDDLVTVAASRIFNRSGKTQVVKKMTMKNILDEVFDDLDPAPYTSIEKVEEKKKTTQKKVISVEQYIDKSNVKNCSNHSVDSVTSVSSIITSKFNEIQPAVTSISSNTSSNVATSSASLITTPLVESTTSQTLSLHLPEKIPKVNEGINNTSPLKFGFDSPIVSTTLSTKTNNKVNNKSANQIVESTNNTHEFKSPELSLQNSNEQNKLLIQSPEKNENILNDKSQNDFKNDKNESSFHFTLSASKPNEHNSNSTTVSDLSKTSSNNLPTVQFGNNSCKEAVPSLSFGEKSPKQSSEVSKADAKQLTPIMQFGDSKVDDKQSTQVLKFGSPNGDKKTTPIMQFGAPNTDDKHSTQTIQFGTPKVDVVKATPTIQFGTPKVDNKESTPVVVFGASKVDKQTTPVMQFGAPKLDNEQTIPTLQFGVSKEPDNSNSTPLFSFGNNNKSSDNSKPFEPVQYQFGSPKSDNTSSKNVVFGSNNLQNQNLFNFGKTDPPKYDTSIEKSTPKLQFGVLPTPVFGTSNADQTKPQFSVSATQSTENQGPKLVFGSPITDKQPSTLASGINFTTNPSSSIFQFNSSISKNNDKLPEAPSSTFQFSSTKPASTFGTSAQDFGDKPAFQFNAQKTEAPKTQFSTPAFGSNTNNAPFKFGSNDKTTSFGSTFSSSNQTLQFTNNTEKTVEPFKFGSTVPSSNTFQFSANKTDNGPVKFGQISNPFPTPAFNGFGNTAPQQTTNFASVSPPQPSSFGNMTSPSAVPTFGSVAPPISNTFGTSQGFQFGSTNNAPSTSSTFAFGSNSQPTKPDGAFNFNAALTTASPFQFGQAPPTMSTPQFGGAQSPGAFGFGSPPMPSNVMPGSSQPLFSMGTAPAGERRKAKAVRRRQ